MSHENQNTIPEYPPTEHGLGLAVEDAINRHSGAVAHIPAEKGDDLGRTGGDELILYPDATNPKHIIRIATEGVDAKARRFPGYGVNLLSEISANGRNDKQYRILPTKDGHSVWGATPSTELPGALDAVSSETNEFATLIAALSTASTERPERPAGKIKRMMRGIGATSLSK